MKLGIFSTHPIQYQVPIWKKLSAINGWDVETFYFNDQGISGDADPGFGQPITWDTPLLEGYSHKFLTKEPIDKINSFKIPGVRDLLAGHQFDAVLIHGYMHAFARQLIRNKNRFGYKVIMRGEFTDMPRRKFGLRDIVRSVYLHWFYRYVDHFCPIGVDAQDHLQRMGVAVERQTLSPYSVNDALFERNRKELSRDACRKTLGIEEGDCVFLYSGKLIPRKQPMQLADAALKLYRAFPHLVLIYLGTGELMDEVSKALAPKLGYKFIAPGFVNQTALGEYFRAADVFVLPSRYDTWGLVVNEAMHFGLPCIVSDMVGCRADLVSDGETGSIYNHTSFESLAEAMRTYLEDPGRTKVMGENAHERIQDYTVEKTVQGLKNAIEIATAC